MHADERNGSKRRISGNSVARVNRPFRVALWDSSKDAGNYKKEPSIAMAAAVGWSLGERFVAQGLTRLNDVLK
jgi:hypothetical protein